MRTEAELNRIAGETIAHVSQIHGLPTGSSHQLWLSDSAGGDQTSRQQLSWRFAIIRCWKFRRGSDV